MTRQAEGRRGRKAWQLRPRPTVSDLERSDAIVLDGMIAVTLTLVLVSLPALAGLVYQAATF